MHNCKYQCKIDLFHQIINPDGYGGVDAQFNSIDQSCPGGAFLDCPYHLLLQINTNHMAGFPNEARQRQSKKPHPTSHLQHYHPLMDVWLQMFPGCRRAF